MAGEARDVVFISYSHRDGDWLSRLLTSLKVYASLDVWADKYIEAGGQWRRDIATALSRSSVGVLLVSDHFLASDFIRNEELPQLLNAADAGDMTLFAIAVSASGYKATPLSQLQFAHSPDEPLDGMRVPKRNAAFAHLAEQIATAAQKVAASPRPPVRSERAAVAPLAPVTQTGRISVLHGAPATTSSSPARVFHRTERSPASRHRPGSRHRRNSHGAARHARHWQDRSRDRFGQ